MATKEKINLLDVIPFRSTHITTEKESDGLLSSLFPGLNTTGCVAFCFLKECLLIFMSVWRNMVLLCGS